MIKCGSVSANFEIVIRCNVNTHSYAPGTPTEAYRRPHFTIPPLAPSTMMSSVTSPNHEGEHLHEWYKKQPGDVRSPCPALNALANLGYL